MTEPPLHLHLTMMTEDRTSPKTCLYNRDISFQMIFRADTLSSSLVTRCFNTRQKLERIEKIIVKERNYLTYPIRLQTELYLGCFFDLLFTWLTLFDPTTALRLGEWTYIEEWFYRGCLEKWWKWLPRPGHSFHENLSKNHTLWEFDLLFPKTLILEK